MIIVNTDKETFISGSCNNKNFRVPYSEEMLNKLKKIQVESGLTKDYSEYMACVESFKEVLSTYNYREDIKNVVDNLVFLKATGKYHIQVFGKVLDKVYVPDAIVDLILDNVERGIETEPLVKMCIRFLDNPKPTQERFNMLANYITQTWFDSEEAERLVEEEGLSEEVAKEMATYADLQITAEGYLKTSKVVDEVTEKYSIKLDDKGKPVLDDEGNAISIIVPRYADSYTINEETGETTKVTEYPEYLEDRVFKPAIYSGGDNFLSGDELGYKYQIGKLAKLPEWDMVSMTDGSKHEKGLHTGGLSYIQGYRHGDREVLDAFVCPSQIGKFTDEGLGEMTCKEFFIYGTSTVEGNLRSMYHTSTYTELRKEDLLKRIDEISDTLVKDAEKLEEDAQVKHAVIDSIL